MKRFRGGLVFKAYRLLYHSTAGVHARDARRVLGVRERRRRHPPAQSLSHSVSQSLTQPLSHSLSHAVTQAGGVIHLEGETTGYAPLRAAHTVVAGEGGVIHLRVEQSRTWNNQDRQDLDFQVKYPKPLRLFPLCGAYFRILVD